MVTYRPILSTGEIHHVFNRSVGKERIFNKSEYIDRIVDLVDYYRAFRPEKFSTFRKFTPKYKKEYLHAHNDALVNIYAFAFMPNHFHFLLRQQSQNGISRFLSNTQNSFAKYFNLKEDRVGGLLQSSFKARLIKSEYEFIHVSRYIHLNPITSRIIEFDELFKSSLTSFSWYINEEKNRFIDTVPILNYFKEKESYVKFVRNQIDYQRELKKINDLLME